MVLDLWDQDGSGPVRFAQEDEDHLGETVNDIWLDRRKYLELGGPRQITVTIEPGDRLNP